MTIEEYTPASAKLWDEVVRTSRNGIFQHLRGYMDYHADRFADCSLMARDDRGRVVAVLPAHRTADGNVASHRGLTFGGWLMTQRADVVAMTEIWRLMAEHYHGRGASEIYYRPAPYIYIRYPAQEDIYALLGAGGMPVACHAASVLDVDRLPGFDMSFRQDVRRAARSGTVIGPSDDYEGFWTILTERLATRHGASPVHTLAEMQLLHSRFPENIQLYTAVDPADGTMLGGIVMYHTAEASHSQYTATTEAGRRARIVPALTDYIISDMRRRGIRYLDLGTSSVDSSGTFDPGLIHQKCAFGARAVAYISYKIKL